MAHQRNWSRLRTAPFSAKTCDPRFLPCYLLYLLIIRKRNRSIAAMIYIPTCMSSLSLVGVSLSLFILPWRQTSSNSSSAAMSFWPSWLVLCTLYHFEAGLLDSRSLIQVTQRTIRRSHCSAPASCSLMMLMDWAISQMRSLTLLSIHCVLKPPRSCQIPMVSAAYWLTPTLAFLAQTQTCRGGTWIVLVSQTTHFGNQKASHYIVGF